MNVTLLPFFLLQRAEGLASQLSDREVQLAAARRQLEEKEAGIRSRDSQVGRMQAVYNWDMMET